MSSTSTTAQESRSPSPLTPEPSGSPEPVSIQSELDLTSSWYLSMHPAKTPVSSWTSEPSVYTTPHKSEEEQMLRLDELIEQHAYDDSPSSGFSSTLSYSSPPPYPPSLNSPPTHHHNPVLSDFRTSNLLMPARHGPISLTKPIPPPASLPRKADPSTMNQRVVHPPKESCFNLPIMFPSIPEGGAKSRVETQVRVTVDLADSSSSSDPHKYDRVGSWKWLKLPQGTATKKRTRKQGKIDPDPQDILHLSASVTCASPPHNRVLSCSSCQAREAKRVAKKLAARVRPARSESESEGDPTKLHKSKHYEDTTSIIQFNCAEILDFSTGSVVLPLRITCYCRHHREKVGFNVHFSMMDHTGRIVGSGMSRPIMITDDHKTSTTSKVPELANGYTALDHPDWSQVGGMLSEIPPIGDARAPSRRSKDMVSSGGVSKKRPKPYDASAKPNRVSREGSLSSVPSPSTSYSPLPTTRASTPFSTFQAAIASEPPGQTVPPPLYDGLHGSETSSPDSLSTPLDHNSDVYMPEVTFTPSICESLPPPSTLQPQNLIMSQPMPFMFFDPNQSTQAIQMQPPTIHRLIPNTGPTHGGIEVTVLGANFHPTVQLNCVFGDVAASSTQRWSDNTLVCVLPPRSMPGVVAVWFEGFPKVDEQNHTPPSLFTYSDESDRALMELALQVVGLKMTGKIEDAKNVAMRIVGNAGSDGSESNNNNSGMMQLASSTAMRDLRPLLLVRAGEDDAFENRIINFLALIDTPLGSSAPNSISTADAISFTSPSGLTLLHLASFLGLPSLTSFLVSRGADLDVRDRNGFTPLHFASLSQSKTCALILMEAGADVEVVNALGKTPEEIAAPGFFGDILSTHSEDESDDEWSDDDDAEFGDAEEEDVPARRIISRRISRRPSRLNVLQSGRGTPRRSVDVSRSATPPPLLAVDDKANKSGSKIEDDSETVDAKRAASFMEKMIQRTLAQIPATQGLIPNIPQLPLPHLPDLKAVQWATLPQIPLVFPVFVPMMPNWPSFLGGEHAAGTPGERTQTGGDDASPNMGTTALRAAQEWRATWEKWVALAVATTARQQTEELPPPEYTPRAAESETTQASAEIHQPQEIVASTSTRPPSEIRPVGYDSTPVPDQVVESFGYQPTAKQTQKLQKKHDRMLLMFWLPILLLSMLWAFHNGVRFAFQAIKMALPKTPLRS
ncbi:hypothetical protein GALMADRAFT_249088 [Galerina marginata CBS 339.88]|uniref:IPT/TIG domain-containing protein n=1 Tax=Galerina marginata (strain CBS 339.88) TaxID=685588 RepID=A0A067T824_GALM3|nr:hypothetical protein GALMADRAFT_249088 [Galerina marginata CBS 339.88]